MTRDRDPVIAGGIRTPFARAWTDLAAFHPVDLGRVALRELVERTEIDPGEIDEVVAACSGAPADALNVARAVALEAKLPGRIPAHTVNRDGASGFQAVVDAAYRIRSGDADLVAVVAVESMSRRPLLFRDEALDLWVRKRRARGWLAHTAATVRARPRHLRPEPALRMGLGDRASGRSYGEIAEGAARDLAVTREDQDRFADESQRRAAAAWESGALSDEVVPVPLPPAFERFLERDNAVREGSSVAALAALPPRYLAEYGTVTAGNSAPVADGAVALLLASGRRASELGLPILAHVRAWGSSGCEPRVSGLGPVFAVPHALKRSGIPDLDGFDLVEWNEGFAAEVLACLRACASRRFCERRLGRAPLGEVGADRLNVHGGAIALGHPGAAAGARLLLRLALEMSRRDATLGLAATSAGGTQGAAVVLDRS